MAYTEALAEAGFEFVVLPAAYAVHLPHAPSPDLLAYRHDARYKRCVDRLMGRSEPAEAFLGREAGKEGPAAAGPAAAAAALNVPLRHQAPVLRSRH